MKEEFSKEDMHLIFSKYNVGKFVSFGKVIKDDTVSLGQVIETSKGKVFMKVLRDFDLTKKQGLKVMYELGKKKYPVFKIYKSKKEELFVNYKKRSLALFEYVKIKEHMEWAPMNKKKVSEYSKMLAKFHLLTKNIKLKSANLGNLNNLKELVMKFYKKRKKYSKEYQEILNFMNNEIKTIQCPSKEYKTGYFSEFNPGHVIFERNKVKYVIDWEIGYDNAFYDFGSSMVGCFSNKGKKFSYDKLNEYVKSYNRIRKLSNWEREHIYEALKFGCLKYGIWEFADIKTSGMKEENNLDLEGIRMVKFLMNTSKEEFLKKRLF